MPTTNQILFEQMRSLLLACRSDTAALPLSRTLAKLTDLLDTLEAQVRSREELAQQKLASRTVVDEIPALIGYWDKNSRNVFANKAYLTYFGKTPEQVAGIHISELLGPALYEKNRPYIERALRGSIQRFERQIPLPSGAFKIVLASYVPDFDDDGKVAGFYVITIDVTDLRAAEHEGQVLRERIEHALETSQKSEKILQAIIEQAPIGIVQLGRELQFLAANPMCSKIFGYSERELSSMCIWDLCHPDDVDSLRRGMAASSSHESLRGLEIRCIHPSGRVVWLRISSQPLQISGSEASQLTVIEDVTEAKERDLQNSLLLETMSNGFLIYDGRGRIKSLNPSASTMLGLTPDQLPAPMSMDPFWQAFKTDGGSFTVEEHPARIALETGEKVVGAVMGLKQPTGEDRWVQVNATPFCPLGSTEDVPEKRHALVVFSDVTDLIASQRENRFILDTLQIGIWKLNPLDRSLHWDPGMYEIYDLRQRDFADHGLAWESTLSGDEKSKLLADIDRALRGEKEFDYTFEIETQSYGKRFISSRAKVTRDALGAPRMMYGVAIDVTNLKLVEREKELISSFLENVLDNVPATIFVKNYQDDLRFSLLNKAGKNLLGLTERQILGKNDYDFFPKEQADSFTQKDREVFARRTILKIEKEAIDTVNGQKFLETYKVPTFDTNGEPQFLIGISRDITEEVRTRAELELERAKSLHSAKLASLGEMSAGIAHEINNPLAIIEGTARVLPKFAHDPDALRAKIAIIENAVHRAAKIVCGLRKFSRTASTSELKVHSLKRIVHEVLTLIDANARRTSTRIEVVADSDANIVCNEIEIEQVLVNLINNGIDAVNSQPERWVHLHLREDESRIVLQVTDSGHGIPKKVAEKLFQPFFTTKVVGMGTGLGLSIVKGILDEHGASIRLREAAPNTCFEIVFKRAKGDNRAA
jgi:PAS domain S-box-containing protein